MRKQLTRIERLDAQIPGLAEQVGTWFAQGLPVRRVAVLLFERYHLSLPPRTVGNFRARRWVPEQERLREKRLEALAAQEVAREREVRAALAFEVSGDGQ